MIVDDDEIELAAGDILRVAPEGKRQLFAAEDADLSYECVQVKSESLDAYTADDAIIYE